MKKPLQLVAFHPFESYSYQENLAKLKWKVWILK